VRGGLVDLEFIAQHLQPGPCGRRPVLNQNTVLALQNLQTAGLLPA
jgi:glutamine synthetase adenylyltransferase